MKAHSNYKLSVHERKRESVCDSPLTFLCVCVCGYTYMCVFLSICVCLQLLSHCHAAGIGLAKIGSNYTMNLQLKFEWQLMFNAYVRTPEGTCSLPHTLPP